MPKPTVSPNIEIETVGDLRDFLSPFVDECDIQPPLVMHYGMDEHGNGYIGAVHPLTAKEST